MQDKQNYLHIWMVGPSPFFRKSHVCPTRREVVSAHLQYALLEPEACSHSMVARRGRVGSVKPAVLSFRDDDDRAFWTISTCSLLPFSNGVQQLARPSLLTKHVILRVATAHTSQGNRLFGCSSLPANPSQHTPQGDHSAARARSDSLAFDASPLDCEIGCICMLERGLTVLPVRFQIAAPWMGQ